MTILPSNPSLSTPAEGTTLPPTTSVRYGVLGFSVTMSILLYLDRFALTLAQLDMKKELSLDDQQMHFAQSAFFFSYALAQVPAGWLSQRFGARLMLGLYVFVWSLALGGMATVTGLASLVLFRLLLGLGQAGAYPCAGGLLKRWFPVESRGFANSFTAMGGRFGFLLSTAFTPQLMALAGVAFGLITGKWRPVFLAYSVLGILWSLGFWFWYRNSPAEHASCNEGERQLITKGGLATNAAAASVQGPPRSALVSMLTSPTVWILCLINFFVNVGWIFLAASMPVFLENTFPSLDSKTIGLLTAVPGIASMCGGLLGGVATDRLVSRFGLKWGRRLTGIIATSGGAIAYLLCLLVDSFAAYVCLFAAAGFLIDFGLGSLWAVYQDIAGKNVATVLGFANMCGNLAAFFFAMVIGYFAKRNDWSSVFLISSGALLLTMICWFFVNPEKKLSAEE